MYFGEIFRKFVDIFPRAGIVIDPAEKYRNRYNLPFVSILHSIRKKLARTNPDGQRYDTEVKIPDPLFPVMLWRQNADVLIAIEFTPTALVAAAIARLRRRCRLVLLVESDPVGRGGSRNAVVRAIKRWVVRHAAAIQTNNEKGLRYLVEDLNADPRKVTVAPYLTSRPPGPAPCLNLVPSPLRLLFANSITPRKGLRQLLDAIARLAPDVRARLAVTIVGDGPERSELESVATALDMGPRIRFVGRRDYEELGQFYAEADVLAIPSLADYRSLAGFEGLGYGLALLSSQFDGATEETVVEGVNGYGIDPHDAADFSLKIAELVNDPIKVVEMRKASYQRYQERFSLERIAANLSESVACALGRTIGRHDHDATTLAAEPAPRDIKESAENA